MDVQHLPMGLMWHMPIPVACSLAVAVGGLAATCGQCPLDQQGTVMHPGDAPAQARLVAGMVQGVLDHLPGFSAALLVVYHDAQTEADVLAPLAAAFPEAVLLPVPLPHFYYPGMRIEVDLYAVKGEITVQESRASGAVVRRVLGGPLDLVAVEAPDAVAATAVLGALDADRCLSAQWFAADPAPEPWHPDPAARVVLGPGRGMRGVLTLAPGSVVQDRSPGGALRRRSGDWVWLSAIGQKPDLAEAAHQAMDALALAEMPGLSIIKATTHYVGGPTPEDLHGNLAVRHARFPMPGPGSTGVPVAGLAGGTLAVGMLGVQRDG